MFLVLFQHATQAIEYIYRRTHTHTQDQSSSLRKFGDYE